MSRTVLVTGAGGFLGAHIVEQLLRDPEINVVGTVRSVKNTAKNAFLLAMPGARERLRLVEADLMVPGSFDEVMKGVDVCMHVASPYIIDAKDPQRDLVEPAVAGTTSVLEACLKAGTVKQVILTSSTAAVADEPPPPGVKYTEKDWNTTSSLTRNPYYYSKTLAERAAWEFAETKAKDAFKLVVINPFMIIGPSHTPTLNQSVKVVRDVYIGKMPRLEFTWGFVDVRDVAKAHILAMNTPTASGRYICFDTTLSMDELIEILEKHVGGAKTAAVAVPNWLAHTVSYLYPTGTGSYMRANIGRGRYDADTSKIRNELGMTFMPVITSITQTIADCSRWKHLE